MDRDSYSEKLDEILEYGSADEFVTFFNPDRSLYSLKNNETAETWVFQLACAFGNVAIAQWLYANRVVDINNDNRRSYTEDTPLGDAIYQRRFDVIRWLLTLPNLSLNITDNGGLRPLCAAIVENFPEDIIDTLIQLGPVNSCNDEGTSPLHCAALRNNIPVIYKLMAAGADLKQVDEGRSFPISHATEEGARCVMENWNAIMVTQCLNEHGVHMDCNAMAMMAELAFDNQEEENA